MKNTETVKALEAVIETAQAELKRLTQPQEKKVIGREDIVKIIHGEREVLWSVGCDGSGPIPIFADLPKMADTGELFTTKENCEAFIAYQKAVANLMYACKPFLSDNPHDSFTPVIGRDGLGKYSAAYVAPAFLKVNSAEKAFEIAEAHKEDLKVYLNYKWEL